MKNSQNDLTRRQFIKTGIGNAAAITLAGPILHAESLKKSTQEGAGGLICGSFISCFHPNVWDMQYSDATLFWKEENWRALIQDMNNIGMNTVIWANTAFWGRPLFPGYEKTVGYPLQMGCTDPLKTVAEEADRLDMKVFYGMGLRGRVSQVRDYNSLQKPWPDSWFQWNTALAEALVDRYSGHKSFGGLYIPYEIVYQEHHYELYEKLIKTYLRPAIGKVKLLISPGSLGDVPTPDTLVRDMERIDIDILAPQDLAGRFQDIDQSIKAVRKNADALERFAKPIKEIGVTLWSNCETFVLEKTPDGRAVCMPGPIERISRQIEIQSPLVEKLITWIYPGVMNRHSELVNIGHPSTDQLYHQYVAYLKEKKIKILLR